MSRQLKFRIYNKTKKEFYYCNDLYFGITDEYIANNCLMSDAYRQDAPEKSVKDCESDNVVIQQYTGIKGSNGIEVYEGDILKIKEYDDEDEEFVRLCEVKFGNGSFDGGFYAYIGFFLEDKYGYDLEPNEITSLTKMDGHYSFEVIGNIFENPDLLKN